MFTLTMRGDQKQKTLSVLGRFARSIWFFPVILLIPLVVATALQINGSSVRAYHQILYGKAVDQDLVANQPRPIRSDEWLVTTQQTIAQSKDNFSRINNHIGNGQDMSILDVPYKDWNIVFKPHN